MKIIQNKVVLILSSILLSISLVTTATSSISHSYIQKAVGMQYNKELECLAQNIYYESASESYEGKLAVAQVTINRVNSKKFAKTICGVVNQKDVINGNTICQFSWVCSTVTASFRNKYRWEESMLAAKKALTEPVAHDAIYRSNALYYHATEVNPKWHLTVVTRIGNHIFYKERNGKV